MRYITIVLIALLVVTSVSAQINTNINTSNPYRHSISSHNPAALVFVSDRQIVFGLQDRLSALDPNHLYQGHVSYFQPLGSDIIIGSRIQSVLTNHFQRTGYSVFGAIEFIEDKLALGFDGTFLNLAYRKDNFYQVDMNDPLLQGTLSKTVPGLGLNVAVKPLWWLSIGGGVDYINQPDLSLDNSGINKDMEIKMGVSFFNFPMIPQIEYLREGLDKRLSFSLYRRFLNNQLGLDAGYEFVSAENTNLYMQLELYKGPVGLHYEYNYHMGPFQDLSTGSHQIVFSYSFNGFTPPPAPPSLDMTMPEMLKVTNPTYNLSGVIRSKSGINDMVVFRNDKIIYPFDMKREGRKEIPFSYDLTLEKGLNKVKFVASSDGGKIVRHGTIYYEPPVQPDITVIQPQKDSTKTKFIKLELEITGIENDNQIIIIINRDTLKSRSLNIRSIKDKWTVSGNLNLDEGENHIQIMARNLVGHCKKNVSIKYNPSLLAYRKTWAVLIAIDRYKNFNEPLDKAVADAESLKTVLINEFHFDHVITLYNEQATKKNIVAVLGDTLKNKTGPEDGVIVYFGGHGDTENLKGDEKIGYIIPYDGRKDSYSENVSMQTIRETADLANANHIFYILDCCFSGIIFQKNRGDDERNSDISILFNRPCRYVLTAGRHDEKDIDGILMKPFLKGLRNKQAEVDNDGVLSCWEISQYVSEKIRYDARLKGHLQTPEHGHITPDSGEFFFIKQ